MEWIHKRRVLIAASKTIPKRTVYDIIMAFRATAKIVFRLSRDMTKDLGTSFCIKQHDKQIMFHTRHLTITIYRLLYILR